MATLIEARAPGKLVIAGEYAVLAFLFVGVARRYVRGRRITPLLVAGCIVLAAMYGASDEFHFSVLRTALTTP